MRSFLKNITDWYFTKKAIPYWCILLLDSIQVLLAGYISLFLTRRGAFTHPEAFIANSWGLLFNVLLYAISFKAFHTYHGIVRYSTFHDLANISSSTLAASMVSYGFSKLLRYQGVTSVVMPNFYGEFIIFVCVTLSMFIIRVVVKFMFELSRTDRRSSNVFIYGVLEGGISLAKSVFNQDVKKYNLKGFVSPNGDFVGQRLLGVRVYPDNLNLINVMSENNIDVVMVSPMQTDHFRENQELLTAITDAGIKIMVMSQAEEWDGRSALSHERMREVEIEDLLPRDKIEVDMDAIGQNLRRKRILITGAAGSIGSEMVRQIAKYTPAEMVLIDQAETPMHDVRLYMAEHFPKIKCFTIVGSITNRKFMEIIFDSHRPDYVLHAAAYKHVPMMEDNPAMAVQNNIEGTRVIADLAVKYKTGKFVYPVDKWGVDLQSEHERYLVEKHYKRPVILINYPKEIKAFYMKQNEDGKTVRAMDVLFPQIGEIIGGSQREESYEKLLATIEERNIPKKDMWWYLETRKFGTVPHSGFGLGFERLILFVTGMSNIRDVIPFPRTPKTAEF